MATQVIGIPMVNAGAFYVNGLTVSRASGTTLGITSGACRDSTNVNDIVLNAAVTLNAAFQGANGIDIGALANSTFYAVYAIASSLYAQPAVNIIQQSLNGVIQAAPVSTTTNNYAPATLISLSGTQPQLPAGYDMFRRIGYVKTDGAAAFLPFFQVGNGSSKWMWYDTAIQVLNAGASAAYAAVVMTPAVPPVVGNTNVVFNTILTPTAATNGVNLRPTGSASTNGFAIMSGDVAGVAHQDSITCPVELAAGVLSLDYKVVGTVSLNVTAYLDNL